MKFGDVIQYEGYQYVYLAATTELIYLAIIPGHGFSQKLIARREKVFTTNSVDASAKQSQPSWAFIVLTTADFKNRIAHYGNPQYDYRPEYFIDSVGVLEIADQKALHKEIMNDSAVPKGLKALVADLVV